MNRVLITHARLDRCLNVLAQRPERFTQRALRRCAALEARGYELEISDPSAWRESTGSTRFSLESQLGNEIKGLRRLGREEELRLALRIEFARLSLDRALERVGLGPQDRNRGNALPSPACRRSLEWHALRLELVERHLYLVLINVERYRHLKTERSDLIQAASAALFRAVDGFDWRRGVLFRTYAVHWLNQGFRSHLYDTTNTVRLPVYLQKSTKHTQAAIQRLGDRHASVEQIADEAGLRASLVSASLAAAHRTRSLDAPLGGLDGSRSLAADLAGPGDGDPYDIAMEEVSVESGVSAALTRLSERERRVVKLRFGIGCDRAHIFSEVAADLGVSLERTRQILARAIDKLRTQGSCRVLEPLIS